jgi:3-keto-5-aminohexanoate cleavage enzyme
MQRQLPLGSTFTVAGMARWQLPMTALAILMGGHVRVGLEDNLYYTKGKLARNEELVSRVRLLSEQLQRDVAKPDEARLILGLGNQMEMNKKGKSKSAKNVDEQKR